MDKFIADTIDKNPTLRKIVKSLLEDNLDLEQVYKIIKVMGPQTEVIIKTTTKHGN